MAPGPEVIGQTGDNSYGAMFGRNWLLVWDRDTGFLHAFQEAGGEWLEVTEELPPVFDAGAPVGSRRWSLAFDQAARVILAYEDAEGVVRVTRWDASLNEYVQNVTFAGVDPCVVMDAAWSLDIPQSDVLLFYLSPDRTRVLCRVQRDVYAVEHEIWDYGQPVILDRVIATPLRYQVLVSDATGTSLPEMLLSDLYPYAATETVTAAGALTATGAYSPVVLSFAGIDPVVVAASGPASGAYSVPVLDVLLGDDTVTAFAAGPASGAYADPLLEPALPPQLVEVSASAPDSGAYTLVVLHAPPATHIITGAASGPVGGSYDPA